MLERNSAAGERNLNLDDAAAITLHEKVSWLKNPTILGNYTCCSWLECRKAAFRVKLHISVLHYFGYYCKSNVFRWCPNISVKTQDDVISRYDKKLQTVALLLQPAIIYSVCTVYSHNAVSQGRLPYSPINNKSHVTSLKDKTM